MNPPGDATPGGAGLDRPILALLIAHQRRCWRQGQRVSVEDYLARQPGLQADDQAVLDLIYHEIMLREEVGEAPQLEEYLRRFPHLDRPLRLQFEVEGAIRPADPTLGGAATAVTTGGHPRRAPAGRPSPGTRSSESSAAAAWGSFTRPTRSGSTGSSP
jgi:hypothetical protein